MPIFFGAIADDDTGATDLAGMLTSQGMRTVLVLQGSSDDELQRWTAGCDAVVIGTASRSIAKQDAYARTVQAAQALRSLGAQVLAVKYCSTFDSTAEGNIGATIDAAMDITGERLTVALPALPALGRTTYMGYHFVGDKLLSDSAMRHHPLNPMTNAHLRSLLQSQTAHRVGLVPFAAVAAGSNAVREHLDKLQADGVQIALLDCVDDSQLRVLGEAFCQMPLLTGSSAWGMVLPAIWRERGMWHPAEGERLPARMPGGHGHLIVSGSCSEATTAQNAWAAANGMQLFALNAIELAQGNGSHEAMLESIAACLNQDRCCLLTTTMQPGHKHQVHAWAAAQGLSPLATGERISSALAQIVAALFQRATPRGLIIAGGETSSALMRALRLGGLRIGPNIEPGIPACVTLAMPQLGVALKSGNFGAPDFYARAITAIESLPLAKEKTG